MSDFIPHDDNWEMVACIENDKLKILAQFAPTLCSGKSLKGKDPQEFNTWQAAPKLRTNVRTFQIYGG